jgi:uncharacterized protein YbjT (DUF2867 family)
MNHAQQIITIFGGSGFVGQHIVRALARAGYRLRLVERDIHSASALKTQGEVGQITVMHGDVTKPSSYVHALEGAYSVVNLVGILYQKGKQTFASIHTDAAENLAKAATNAGISRLLHMSALGVDKAVTSEYARTKLAGEKAVRAAFPTATIFRPSVIFGAEDNFYNQFACMSRILPFLPLIGGGETKFQPVYVGDVAQAFACALSDDNTQSHMYELGGADVLTFRQILDSIREMTYRTPYLLPIPSPLAKAGALFAEFLPVPPLTRDQVELLKYNNIVSDSADGFASLGITPHAVSSIVPQYLARFAKEHPKKESFS